MKNYKLAINIGGRPWDNEVDMIRCAAAAGFDGCFINWKPDKDMDMLANEIAKAGLIYQSVHGPFGSVQTLWDEGDEGDAYVDVLIKALRDTQRVGAPLMVVHPIKGMYRHTPTELGLVRFARLVEEAEKTNVKLAFENVEGVEYLHAVMERFGDSESVGFCWDTGHEMCYNFSEDMMSYYGDKLIATHFDDNLGIADVNNVTWLDDLHLFPFDGVADWQGIMDRIARHGYEGILTFELTAGSKPDRHDNDKYAALSTEEYFAKAYDHAKRVAALAR